jgi:hypothetical protein
MVIEGKLQHHVRNAEEVQRDHARLIVVGV